VEVWPVLCALTTLRRKLQTLTNPLNQRVGHNVLTAQSRNIAEHLTHSAHESAAFDAHRKMQQNGQTLPCGQGAFNQTIGAGSDINTSQHVPSS